MIRPAVTADGDTVIALWHACGLTRPWNDPAADFARAIGGPTSTVLLLLENDTPVGTVMAGYDGHRGWLYYLGVSAQHRGRGHGRALIGAACDFLQGLGCPKVELMVRHDNPAAAMYARLGWERQAVETWALRL